MASKTNLNHNITATAIKQPDEYLLRPLSTIQPELTIKQVKKDYGKLDSLNKLHEFPDCCRYWRQLIIREYRNSNAHLTRLYIGKATGLEALVRCVSNENPGGGPIYEA